MVSMSPSSYECTWKVALEKLETYDAIAECDSYASFALSNLLHASIQTHATQELLKNNVLLLLLLLLLLLSDLLFKFNHFSANFK